MHKFILIVVIIVLASSCDEFNTTQKDGPGIFTNTGLFELPADGKSSTIIELRFENLLASGQPIEITTTHGYLVELPSEDFANGSKTINCNPNSKIYQFAMVSEAVPVYPVLLSVKVNNIVVSKEFDFVQVCPTELLFDIDDSELSISAGERVTGTFSLSNGGNTVSDNIRIDISINDSSLAKVNPRIFYNSSSSNEIEIIPKGKPGNLVIKAEVNQNGCINLIQTKSILIED